MLHWINSHGVECVLGYGVFAAIVGSMPPLPDSAGYYHRWAYGFLHLFAMNLRASAQMFNIKLPEGNKGDSANG